MKSYNASPPEGATAGRRRRRSGCEPQPLTTWRNQPVMRTCFVTLALFAVAVSAAAGNGEIRKVDDPIPGSYIVVLKEDAVRPGNGPVTHGPRVPDVAADMALVYGGR